MVLLMLFLKVLLLLPLLLLLNVLLMGPLKIMVVFLCAMIVSVPVLLLPLVLSRLVPFQNLRTLLLSLLRLLMDPVQGAVGQLDLKIKDGGTMTPGKHPPRNGSIVTMRLLISSLLSSLLGSLPVSLPVNMPVSPPNIRARTRCTNADPAPLLAVNPAPLLAVDPIRTLSADMVTAPMVAATSPTMGSH